MPLSPENRQLIFDTIKNGLKNFAPPMVVAKDKKDVFELIGNIPVPYGSTKKIIPGMYFSSVVPRKDMVSFYFVPMYYHEKDYADVIPNLGKCLKGKICFNFRKPEQVHVKELEKMLRQGVKAWKNNKYMK